MHRPGTSLPRCGAIQPGYEAGDVDRNCHFFSASADDLVGAYQQVDMLSNSLLDQLKGLGILRMLSGQSSCRRSLHCIWIV